MGFWRRLREVTLQNGVVTALDTEDIGAVGEEPRGRDAPTAPDVEEGTNLGRKQGGVGGGCLGWRRVRGEWCKYRIELIDIGLC